MPSCSPLLLLIFPWLLALASFSGHLTRTIPVGCARRMAHSTLRPWSQVGESADRQDRKTVARRRLSSPFFFTHIPTHMRALMRAHTRKVGQLSSCLAPSHFDPVTCSESLGIKHTQGCGDFSLARQPDDGQTNMLAQIASGRDRVVFACLAETATRTTRWASLIRFV